MVQQIKIIATQPDDLSLHSRTEVKSQIQAYTCNPSMPTVRWGSAGGLCTNQPGAHRAERRWKGRKTQLLEVVLTPRVVWHVYICTLTHMLHIPSQELLLWGTPPMHLTLCRHHHLTQGHSDIFILQMGQAQRDWPSLIGSTQLGLGEPELQMGP